MLLVRVRSGAAPAAASLRVHSRRVTGVRRLATTSTPNPPPATAAPAAPKAELPATAPSASGSTASGASQATPQAAAAPQAGGSGGSGQSWFRRPKFLMPSQEREPGRWIIYLSLGAVGYFFGAEYLRRRNVPCSSLGGEMKPVADDQIDQFLTPAQRTEHWLGSAQYRVYQCSDCKDILNVFRTRKWFGHGLTTCPKCGTVSYSKIAAVVDQPTSQTPGVEAVQHCCLHCGYLTKHFHSVYK